MTTMERVSKLPKREWGKNRGVISQAEYDMLNEFSQEYCWGAAVNTLLAMVPDKDTHSAIQKINDSKMSEWATFFRKEGDVDHKAHWRSLVNVQNNTEMLRAVLSRYISGIMTGAIMDYLNENYIQEEYIYFGDEALKRAAQKRGWKVEEKFE